MGALRADVFGEDFFFAGGAVAHADLPGLTIAGGGGEEDDLFAVGAFGTGVEVGVDGVAGGVSGDRVDADAIAPRSSSGSSVPRGERRTEGKKEEQVSARANRTAALLAEKGVTGERGHRTDGTNGTYALLTDRMQSRKRDAFGYHAGV